MFQESSKGVKVRLKGISSSCKGVSIVFKSSLTGLSGKSQRCFKEVSKKFQEWFNGVSREEIQRKFQGSFKCFSRVFQRNFEGVSRKFRGFFKED